MRKLILLLLWIVVVVLIGRYALQRRVQSAVTDLRRVSTRRDLDCGLDTPTAETL